MSLPNITGQRRKYLLLLLLISISVFSILLFKYHVSIDHGAGKDHHIQFPKDYTWLPAVFIYKDLKTLKWFDQINEKYDFGNPDEYFYEDKSKLRLLRFSPGNALIYLPPFLCSHMWCLINNIEPSGYSNPYLILLVVWKVTLLILGLMFSFIFLARYFNPITAFITVLVFLFTTPLLDGPLAESWFPYHQFFLASTFMLCLESFWKKPNYFNTFFLGFSLFFLIGMDLNNAVFVAFVLLWFLSPQANHVKSKIFHLLQFGETINRTFLYITIL